MTKTTQAEPFDEAAYRAKLIAMGSDPEQAADVARKMAATRVNPESPPPAKVGRRRATPAAGPDLFSQSAAAEASPPAPATKKAANKPAKVPTSIERKPFDKPATKRENELVTVSAEIMGQSPTGNDFAFIHAVMCQVGLPRAKVDGERFMRQSGAAWVNVQAGFLDVGHGPVLQPVPYGPMPRLALAWVSTYAKRHSTREIPIGDSAAEFLRLMDMDDQGARYATLRKQMNALAACRLQLGYKGRTYNGQPVEQFDAWVSNRETGQRALWPGVMVLSDHYFRELVDNAVPLDNRALHALKGSALALDVYAWLAHRLHRIEGRPVILYWTNLREQFGQEYQGKNADKDFKREFLKCLRAVLAVYPQALVKQVTGGLMLMASPPPIPYKGQ
ncbi:replication protein [Ralstonia solanacearum]|nr:replication protein RepA [Ralstonia solanacearum]MDB0516282.1 replication protein [Ralstonia solanacearum]